MSYDIALFIFAMFNICIHAASIFVYAIVLSMGARKSLEILAQFA